VPAPTIRSADTIGESDSRSDAGGTGEGGVRVGPWLRRSRRIAYENPWMTVFHDEVDHPDGTEGIYGVVHFANLAVGVVAIDAADNVALVGQWRYTFDEESWEIPEGGVPPTESPEAGARRELREETGIRAATWREIARYRLSNSVTDEAAVLYLATDVEIGTAAPDPSEELTVRWVPFDEVLRMTFDGRITDALTVLGIHRVALERSRAVRPPAGAPTRETSRP
jgi:8-oxo-dGTP pyrophosphatase MutT (NUDIX family)